MDTYVDILRAAEATQSAQPATRHRIDGRWGDLGDDLRAILLRRWKEHLSGPTTPIQVPSPGWSWAWQGPGSAAFIAGCEWVGGTVGDARMHHFYLRLEDDTLLYTYSVDCSTTSAVTLECHGHTPDSLVEAISADLVALSRSR